MKKNQKKFRFLCTGNQNGGQQSTAWQPTDDDNDDRHISKKGRKGQIKQLQEQQKKKNRQRIKITGHKSASSQPAKCVIGLKESKKKKRGGGIPEGWKAERQDCCWRSGAEEGRDGGKKGKETSRVSTPSNSYTPFPQSPPTGMSALVRARGDRRTSAQYGPVRRGHGRIHATHRNNKRKY